MISAEQAEDRPIPRPVETSDQDAERKPRSDMQTWIRQRELEARSVYLGEQRRLKALDKAEEKNRTSFGAGVGIVRRNLPKLAGALEAFVRKQKEQSGPNHTAVKWIEEAGAELAALVTLRVVVNHLPDARPTPDVLEEIAERLRADLNFDRAKAEGLPVSEKGGFQEASKRAREKLKKAGVDLSDLRFTRGERLHLGGALLHVLIETTGLVRQEQHTYEHNKRPTYVVPEDSTLRELEAYRNNGLRWRWPKYAPMVVRPRRWSQGNGGYRFDLDGEVQLLRRSDTEQGDLSRVRRSLDRIQETPWEINEPVLALAREVARRGGDRMGLRSLVEAKPAIPSTEWSPPDDEPYIPPFHDPPREWREKKARWSAATRVEQTLAVAEEMAGDTFWLPHNLDWRGRIYPVPDWLNPQGDDLARGMLRFADGKPLAGCGKNSRNYGCREWA